SSMTTTTVTQPTTAVTPASPGVRRTPTPIPFTRLMAVEMRKMFDTRSGFWMLVSVVAASVVASGSVLLFGGEADVTYANMSSAIGIPMAIILPVIAILSVTSEWSQRSGLTTFTLVPHRGRVIGAKLAVIVLIGIGSMLVAASIGALGNLLGSAIAGVDTVWDLSVGNLSTIILANVLGMLMGFAIA